MSPCLYCIRTSGSTLHTAGTIGRLQASLPTGSTQIPSHSSFVSNLFRFPSVPPYQNLAHPPYSMSKNHLTTKSLAGPLSLGRPHTSAGGWGSSWSSQPWKFSPVAVLLPSGQQPNKLAAQPQPSEFIPEAGVRLSGQQPYSLSLQVQPSWAGPRAIASPSGQQPY